MNEKSLTVSFNVNNNDIDYITKKVIAYNAENFPSVSETAGKDLNIIVKDESGIIIGGIICIYYVFCLYIRLLWVDNLYRGMKLGSHLLSEVEKTARENGCRMMHTDTFGTRSLGFYTKRGFEVFGTLDGYPDNVKHFYLKKLLF